MGCAGVCPKVTRDLREFDQAKAPREGWDVSLSMPMVRLDKLIAPELKKLPKFRFAAPKVAGLKIPSIQVVVESVRLKPAPQDMLGYSIRVSLRASKKRILVLNLAGKSPTRFDVDESELRIALDETKASDLKVSIGEGGTKALSSWVYSQIPKQVRQFTPRGVVDAAVKSLANSALKNIAPQLDKHAPNLFKKVAAIELDFEGIPVAAVRVHSSKQYLEVLGRSTLAGSRPLANPRGRAKGVSPKLGQLKLSGAAAAAIANEAIDQGDISERWNREGEEDEEGEFKARVAWADGKRPLKVELFAENKPDCAHVRLEATPKLAVERNGAIRFATSDAQLEKVVRGNLKVRAAIAFSGIGRKTFTMVERVASSFVLDAGGRTLRVRTKSARATAREVILGFDVSAK
jgi:hypothetical protein